MRPIACLAATALASPALAWDISADDVEPMCTWSDARWEQSATLILPGTRTKFANVHAGDDVRLWGTLGVDLWYRLRFRVALRGTGVEIGGDVDPNEDWVFSLDRDTLELGPTATLVRGGRFEITGAADEGGVIATPDSYAADDVWSPTAWAALPCEDITVHWRAVPETDAMLAAVGVPADAKTLVIPRRKSARLYASPDGVLQGIVQPARYERTVSIIETRDERAHIALPDWTGTVWHGWIDEKRLREPASDDGIGGLFGALGGGLPDVDVRRCEMDTPLRAWVGGRSVEVGVVKAGTPFEVVSTEQGAWSIAFPDGWIAPHGKAQLVVAASASRCPEGTLSRSRGLDLEDVLQDAPDPLTD